jgi:hypothetical protein
MPRIAWLVAAFALSLPALCHPATLPPAKEPQGPPHAWLFGSWTGGLFPAPSQLTAQTCLAHPTVIFTQDLVLRAQLTDLAFAQREVETVRVSAGGTEFRLIAAAAPEGGLFGAASAAPTPGFGCESPDVLHVQRIGPNEISFPGCAEFPNPLVRCPAR